MRKLLLAVAVLAVVVGAGVVAYGYHLLGRLKTPEFKAELLARAKQALGTDVDVSKLDVSLLSGVTLEGVRIANPRPFAGSFLTADEFVLRYRLRSLLNGRLDVQDLLLDKPVIALATDAKGRFNFEKLGARTSTPTGRPPAGGSALPLTLVLSKLEVRDARLTMTDAANVNVLGLEDADFSSRFEVTAAGATGSGKATIATVSLADMLFLRDAKSELLLTRDEVKLAPLEARLAGGEAGGDFSMDLRKSSYLLNLEVKGADVQTLIADAKATGALHGKLGAKAAFQGSGGMETLKGKGRARIGDCRVSNARLLQTLAAALNVPELANPQFRECVVDFQTAGYRVTTPLIRFTGDALQITGRGTANLETSAISYDLNLALANRLLDRMPAREMRAAFRDRGDGFGAIDFKVWGTTLAPQHDLTARVGRAAATEAAKKGLERLLGGRKLF